MKKSIAGGGGGGCCCCCCSRRFHRTFFLAYPLEPTVIPTAQASSCRLQYFPYCVWFVRSIAIFCSDCTEYFPSMASKCFFKTPVTVPVVPVITGLIPYYMFHIFSSLLLLLLLLLVVVVVVVVVVINKNYIIIIIHSVHLL